MGELERPQPAGSMRQGVTWAHRWSISGDRKPRGRRGSHRRPEILVGPATAVHQGGRNPARILWIPLKTGPCPPDPLPAARPAPARREADVGGLYEGYA